MVYSMVAAKTENLTFALTGEAQMHYRARFELSEEMDIIIAQIAAKPYLEGDNDAGTDAEWDALDKEAMSSDRIDAIAEYLRSSGQASA